MEPPPKKHKQFDAEKVDGAAAKAAVETKAPLGLEKAKCSAPVLATFKAPPEMPPWTQAQMERMLQNEHVAREMRRGFDC
jgi:hypothetical protein